MNTAKSNTFAIFSASSKSICTLLKSFSEKLMHGMIPSFQFQKENASQERLTTNIHDKAHNASLAAEEDERNDMRYEYQQEIDDYLFSILTSENRNVDLYIQPLNDFKNKLLSAKNFPLTEEKNLFLNKEMTKMLSAIHLVNNMACLNHKIDSQKEGITKTKMQAQYKAMKDELRASVSYHLDTHLGYIEEELAMKERVRYAANIYPDDLEAQERYLKRFHYDI